MDNWLATRCSYTNNFGSARQGSAIAIAGRSWNVGGDQGDESVLAAALISLGERLANLRTASLMDGPGL